MPITIKRENRYFCIDFDKNRIHNKVAKSYMEVVL